VQGKASHVQDYIDRTLDKMMQVSDVQQARALALRREQSRGWDSEK
jgi:hypothetical protein